MSFIKSIHPKLITFDVTGTLLQFSMTVGQQYAQVGSTFGVTADPELLKINFKESYKKMNVDHPNFGQVTGIGWETWWKQLVALTFTNSLGNTGFEVSKLDNISSRLIDVYKTSEGWVLAKGAIELLEKLKEKNMKLGVISNYDSRLECILDNLKLLKYFDFVVSSYEAKMQKPDKQIFKHVERMNDNVSPKDILHIGDSVELDFFAARNAGWNAILIHNDIQKLKNQYPQIDTNFVVQDLLALKEQLCP